MNSAMYPTKIKKCTFVGKRFFRSERAPTPRKVAIVFGSSFDIAIQPCSLPNAKENGANCALLGIMGKLSPVYSFDCHDNKFQREKQKRAKMADLLNAGEDSPKRTVVFVNHVDLYTGKNISKVRKMTKI